MKRLYAPPAGSDGRDGWDKCLDLEPPERVRTVSKVIMRMDTPAYKQWASGWLDAWDTFGRASRQEIARRGDGTHGAIKTAVSGLPGNDETRIMSLTELKKEVGVDHSKNARLEELRTKVSFSQDSADFVEWCLLKNDRVSATECQRLLERLGLEMKEPSVPGAGPKRGPLDLGEQVIVNKNKNTNPLNVDPCEKWHDHTGAVHEVKPDHLVVQFDSGDRVLFMGVEGGSKTGLYRWTPAASADKPGRSVIEVVYVSDKTAPPPSKERIDMVQDYVAKGMATGESRVEVYYTGLPASMATGKDGTFYFMYFPTQRATPVAGAHPRSVNPVKGHLYYIGILGRRPGGWEADLAKKRAQKGFDGGQAMHLASVTYKDYHGGPINLTPKEISRASDGYTIVTRPQATGGFMVAAVEVATGKVWGNRVPFADSKEDIPGAIKMELRMLDKMQMGGDMSHASRHRQARLEELRMKLAAPDYKTYVEKKRSEGKKPLDRKEWERRVLQTGPANQKKDDDAPKAEVKPVKVPKDIGGIMQQYQSDGDIFSQVGSHATGGKDIGSDKVEEAVAKAKEYLSEAQAGKNGWGKTEVKELNKVIKGLSGLLPKQEAKKEEAKKENKAPGAPLGSPQRLLQQWSGSSDKDKGLGAVGKALEKGETPKAEDVVGALKRVEEWLGSKNFDSKEKAEFKKMKKTLEGLSKKTPAKSEAKSEARKHPPAVAAVVKKHDLEDSDVDEVAAFKKAKPKNPKVKKSDAQLMADFLAKAKPETKERMKGVTPAEFMKMLGAIMDDTEGGGEGASGGKKARLEVLRSLVAARSRAVSLDVLADHIYGRLQSTHPGIAGALGLSYGDRGLKSEAHLNDVPAVLEYGYGADTQFNISIFPTGKITLAGKIKGKTVHKDFTYQPGGMMTGGTVSAIHDFIEESSPAPKVEYRVYGIDPDGPLVFHSREDLLRKFPADGVETSTALRKELQGQPRLKNFGGPMWDGRRGDVIGVRYETWEVNALLSRGASVKGDLRQSLIKLANEVPEMRKHLIPILQKTADQLPLTGRKWTVDVPEKLDRLVRVVKPEHRKLLERVIKVLSSEEEFPSEKDVGTLFDHLKGTSATNKSDQNARDAAIDSLKELKGHLRGKTATEFPTNDALDKYLKDHPNAKREDHSVKKFVPGVGPKVEKMQEKLTGHVEKALASKLGPNFSVRPHGVRGQLTVVPKGGGPALQVSVRPDEEIHGVFRVRTLGGDDKKWTDSGFIRDESEIAHVLDKFLDPKKGHGGKWMAKNAPKAKQAAMGKVAGYTHRWNVTRLFTPEEWVKIIGFAKQIVAKARAKDIVVAGPTGTGAPEFTAKWISLNGDSSTDSDYETFHFPRAIDDGFCKTNQRPYDAVVVSILAMVKQVAPDAIKVSSDGGPSAIKRIFG